MYDKMFRQLLLKRKINCHKNLFGSS